MATVAKKTGKKVAKKVRKGMNEAEFIEKKHKPLIELLERLDIKLPLKS